MCCCFCSYNRCNIRCVVAALNLCVSHVNAKHTSEIIIKNKWCQIIGSDAHDDKKRNFCLYDSLEYVKSLIGYDANKLVHENPKNVIEGRPIDINVNYQNLHEETLFSLIKNKLNLS